MNNTKAGPHQEGRPRRTILSFQTLVYIVIALALHAIYTALSDPKPTTTYVPIASHLSSDDNETNGLNALNARNPRGLPQVFIFRRSMKTGSSSMLSGLLLVTKEMGYLPVMRNNEEVEPLVRAELVRPRPRRLFIMNHNQITRSVHPRHDAVIADTFRDGYEHMTSYCRARRRVKTCDEKLEECLRDPVTQKVMYFRWAGREQEDAETYIDLPLSSAHPALSTTVLRTVFPNVTLNMDHYRRSNTTCPEIPELRAVYNEFYRSYDKQIKMLRHRMLVIAGYPTYSSGEVPKEVSLADKMDAAEKVEALKYEMKTPASSRGAPPVVTDTRQKWRWTMENGRLKPTMGDDHYQEKPPM